jgi:hypothetical protein
MLEFPDTYVQFIKNLYSSINNTPLYNWTID